MRQVNFVCADQTVWGGILTFTKIITYLFIINQYLIVFVACAAGEAINYAFLSIKKSRKRHTV